MSRSVIDSRVIDRADSGVFGSQRRRLAIGLCVALVGVTLPFLNVLFGSRTLIFSDVVGTFVPRYIAVWTNIRQGVSPFWWRNMFGGINNLGSPPASIFYLPDAIFGWLSPTVAYRWWFFGHLWFMTVGWYVWAWRRWQSVLGATVSTLAGTINGYVVGMLVFTPVIVTLAFLPWTFLMIDRVIESGRLRYVAFLALLVAPIAIQEPQFLWLAFVALGVVAVFQLARKGVGIGPWIRVGAGILLGVGLGAVQLLPAVKYSETSVRPELTKTAAFEYSVDPSHLVALLFAILGITLVALAVIGAVRLGRDRLSLALIALALLGVLAALGGRTPVGHLLFDFMPLAKLFRDWTRDLLWTYVAVTMLAGAGAREVARMPRQWAIRFAVAAAGFGALLLLPPRIPGLAVGLFGVEGSAARFIPALLLLALAGAVLLMTRSRVAGAVALIVVCTLDLGSITLNGAWNSLSIKPSDVAATIGNTPPPFGAPADAPDGIDRWMSDVPDASAIWPSIFGHAFESAVGYDPLLQADYAATLGTTYLGYTPNHAFWQGGWMPDVLRTTTLLASDYAGEVGPGWSPAGRYIWPADAPRTTPATGPPIAPYYNIYNYAPRLPESYLVGATRLAPLADARAALTDPATDLTQYAYVDAETIPQSTFEGFAALAEPGFSGSVTTGAMDDGGHGTWDVVATKPSLFVTSYAWMDGWRATVDGKSVPVARTNTLVLGVPVPAGTHTVRLSFTPPGWTAGRNVGLASLLVVLGLLIADSNRVRSYVRRRRLDRATADD